MKDYLMELVMMLFEVELKHANGTKVMKVFVVMTKGATGMFTTSHAVCVEAVNVTYWLVVWPTSAEEEPRLRVKWILGGKWPMDYAGTIGNATNFSGRLKGMPTPPVLLMENRGNDDEADPTESLVTTDGMKCGVSRRQVRDDQAIMNHGAGNLALTSPNPLLRGGRACIPVAPRRRRMDHRGMSDTQVGEEQRINVISFIIIRVGIWNTKVALEYSQTMRAATALTVLSKPRRGKCQTAIGT